MCSNTAAYFRFLFPISLVMLYSASRCMAAVQELPSERQRLRLLFHSLNLLPLKRLCPPCSIIIQYYHSVRVCSIIIADYYFDI